MQILEKNMTEGQDEFKKPKKSKSIPAQQEVSKGMLYLNLFYKLRLFIYK